MSKKYNKVKQKYLEPNKGKKLDKKNIIILGIVILIGIIIFCVKFKNNTVKTNKIGNNSSSQEIVNYVLNISSYEATIDVEVTSNKNTNKYIIKQKCENTKKIMQEVIEPDNIKGVKIIKDDDNLKIENTDLNLGMVLEKYNYISDNVLDLNAFIEDYKNYNESECEEKDNKIVMKTVDNRNERNVKQKKLYIDKSTGNPTVMEISDNNKNSSIYIKYNEVIVNSLN